MNHTETTKGTILNRQNFLQWEILVKEVGCTILEMNCSDPKYGHSAQHPFTYFLCFQLSLSLFPVVSKQHRSVNLTSVSQFFLLGLSDDPELQSFLFILFLSMYQRSYQGSPFSENYGHGIRSHQFMANRWGNNGNSDILYFLELQNHCRWWLQPWD